ncbi:MAG: hypothetical protein ABWX57_09075 [Aeromicrobium sp.]
MSTYTVGEIVAWLAVTAILGFVLGWLARELALRSRAETLEAAAFPVPGPVAPEAGPDPDPEPEPVPARLPATGDGPPSPEHLIKGKTSSMIFHPPGSPSYARTSADTWFRTEEDAVAAGFRKPRNA